MAAQSNCTPNSDNSTHQEQQPSPRRGSTPPMQGKSQILSTRGFVQHKSGGRKPPVDHGSALAMTMPHTPETADAAPATARARVRNRGCRCGSRPTAGSRPPLLVRDAGPAICAQPPCWRASTSHGGLTPAAPDPPRDDRLCSEDRMCPCAESWLPVRFTKHGRLTPAARDACAFVHRKSRNFAGGQTRANKSGERKPPCVRQTESRRRYQTHFRAGAGPDVSPRAA